MKVQPSTVATLAECAGRVPAPVASLAGALRQAFAQLAGASARHCGRLPAVLALLLSGSTLAFAADAGSGYDGALTVTLENDLFTGSDNNYTNGLGISWVSRDIASYDERSLVRRWGDSLSVLPLVGSPGYRTYVAWSIAHEMFTPDDIENPDPPLDDQPYAGALYLDSIVYAKGERSVHAWQLRLGVVGPASRADDVQRRVHSAIGAAQPRGWSTQMPNEPIVNLGYTGSYLLADGKLGGSSAWRLVPVANVGLGNYFTGAGVGLYGEVGWNLVDALGGTALRQGFNTASTVGVGPVQGWSVSLSGGVSGYGVVRYLPLDGTLFRHSRAVESEPFVGMATLGLSVRHGGFVFFAGRTQFTKTFETERGHTEFGTMSASWIF